jgi:hypothetical protein
MSFEQLSPGGLRQFYAQYLVGVIHALKIQKPAKAS